MITVRAARWAAFGAAATMLLTGLAGSARAAGGGGGDPAPPDEEAPKLYVAFGDLTNHNKTGYAAYWDLLSHGAFIEGDSFNVGMTCNPVYTAATTDLKGHLMGEGVANVWEGSGASNPETKEVNTKSLINLRYATNPGSQVYYEYQMTGQAHNAQGQIQNFEIASGGIHSYIF